MPIRKTDDIIDVIGRQQQQINRLWTRSAKSDSWHLIGAAGEPAFVNTWSNFDGVTSFAPARYRQDRSGFIILNGWVKSSLTTATTTMFTLPVGYRPGWQHRWPCLDSGGIASVVVDNTGVVSVIAYISGNSTFVALDPIRFYPEPALSNNT